MSPCSPNDISIEIPETPNTIEIPGFGKPFSIVAPDINPFPEGMPEDLVDIMEKLQLIVPPGTIKPSLNPNFGKDIFDGIMKLLDQFMPFLMMYKFFLPVLNIIICIIEVLCAIPNPFKLSKAIIKLFTQCIPAFLALFPMFALVVMIISLLMLLIALIEYIISQILNLIKTVLHNINMLQNAFQEANSTSILKIAKKIGSVLCIFQNLFVLLAIFAIIIQVIKDILNLVFSIPPCDSNNSDEDGCCTTDVCPAIVKNNYTRTTGKLKYLNSAGTQTTIVLPPPMNTVTTSPRIETWQLFDVQQEVEQKFINIVNAFDVPTSVKESPPFFKPIFFPSDSIYNSQTPIKQAAYTIDLRMFYNPSLWGRIGKSRFITFKDCIVIASPNNALKLFNNGINVVDNGVLLLAGGKGFEEDGVTEITGFDTNGITPLLEQATLENFIHLPNQSDMLSNDGYVLDVEYTFKPNIETLLKKSLVTSGCMPEVALSKEFINNAFASDALVKLDDLKKLSFPNVTGAQECLSTALSTLRFNLTPEGVANFQATTNICLQQLKNETEEALKSLVGIGFDPCKSVFTVDPLVQFTSKTVDVKVNLNENSGLSLVNNVSEEIGKDIAKKIKAHITFGEVGPFSYDGNSSFIAKLSSDQPGEGKIMVSFDNSILCKNTIDPISHTLQEIEYNFVYAPAKGTVPVSIGDNDGAPRRDDRDLSREGINSNNKDII